MTLTVCVDIKQPIFTSEKAEMFCTQFFTSYEIDVQWIEESFWHLKYSKMFTLICGAILFICVAGAVKEYSGSYIYPCYLTVLMYIPSALLLLWDPVLRWCGKQQHVKLKREGFCVSVWAGCASYVDKYFDCQLVIIIRG